MRFLHRMLQSIPWLQSALNFFLNRILISTQRQQRTHNNTWPYDEGNQQCRVSHNNEECDSHLSSSTGIATLNSRNYDQMGISLTRRRRRTVLQTTFYNLPYTVLFETSSGVPHTGTKMNKHTSPHAPIRWTFTSYFRMLNEFWV